ncbi:MAG TPA: IgA Peptidase M64 [Candidatus Acidoferrales bacterium]|nr:IgA Peptidase M64 [Candidatus Acidoferrales bacterium]
MNLRTFCKLAALVPLLAWVAAQAASDRFAVNFTDRTMRVDYLHSGTASEEHISLDQVVSDGPWPGSRTQLLDGLNLGKYFFEVVDRETNRVLYSRGFSSIFGEWETTPEAKKVWRTYHESLRFPWPRRPVQVTLKKRDAQNAFRELWTTVIDPNSRSVIPADLPPRGRVWTLFENGPAAEKVDFLLLGDGYTAAETEKFHADAQRLVDALFQHEPFRSRKRDFNVRAIDLAAAQSGVSRPHAGIFRRSPLSAHYSTFDTERYVLSTDNRTLRDLASAAPYEFLVILLNERTYGGGGIYNLQATVPADNAFAVYVFVHEFGHHFADLGDEYYTSDVAYETGAAELPEPWEPNITALHDPANLKWKDFVEAGTPLPTPWDKEEFEKHSRAVQEQRRKLRAGGAPEEEMEKLFREQQEFETKFLAGMKYSGKVGAFEGARYEVKGLYRPAADCIMFTRDEVGFCPVCRRALERVMDLYSR